MGRHDGHRDEAVTVAELLAHAAKEGRALRLNWSASDTGPRGQATTDNDWPTGVLPRIEDDMPDPGTTGTALAELPRRTPSGIPESLWPVRIESDPDLLNRVLDGLRRLE